MYILSGATDLCIIFVVISISISIAKFETSARNNPVRGDITYICPPSVCCYLAQQLVLLLDTHRQTCCDMSSELGLTATHLSELDFEI